MFRRTRCWYKNMKAAIDAGKAIHLMGLVGTGGVHSHADHWFGVLDMAKHMGATKGLPALHHGRP